MAYYQKDPNYTISYYVNQNIQSLIDYAFWLIDLIGGLDLLFGILLPSE